MREYIILNLIRISRTSIWMEFYTEYSDKGCIKHIVFFIYIKEKKVSKKRIFKKNLNLSK